MRQERENSLLNNKSPFGAVNKAKNRARTHARTQARITHLTPPFFFSYRGIVEDCGSEVV